MLLNPNGSIISLRNSLLFFRLHFNTPIRLIQIQLILGEKNDLFAISLHAFSWASFQMLEVQARAIVLMEGALVNLRRNHLFFFLGNKKGWSHMVLRAVLTLIIWVIWLKSMGWLKMLNMMCIPAPGPRCRTLNAGGTVFAKLQFVHSIF